MICSLSFARKKRKLKLIQFGYGLRIVIKLLIRFANHCNGSVILIWFDNSVQILVILPTPIFYYCFQNTVIELIYVAYD